MQTQHLNEILTTIEYLKSKKPFNDSIGMYINHASWIERIQFNTSTYESLKTIGLDIITNDSIKTDIAYLFGNEFPQKTMWIRDAGMAYANFALPYFVKFFESDGNKGGINIPVDYEALLNNQEFINVLSRKRGLKTVITLRLEELLAYVEKTRARITKELETFD